VTDEQREPWWNDVDKGKLIHPPELSLAVLPAEPSSRKSEKLAKDMMNLV
jgi:hypothetical protein